MAAIAKPEKILYVLRQADAPIGLERHSPVLHLIQQIRDETHRFAVTFHRARRAKRTLTSELHEIPGVGAHTARKLLRQFGSLTRVKQASVEELGRVVPRPLAARIAQHFQDDVKQESVKSSD